MKKFHSVLLKNGAMPLWVMENAVNEWIAKTRNTHNITGTCTYTSGTTRLQYTLHVTLTMLLVSIATVVRTYL